MCDLKLFLLFHLSVHEKKLPQYLEILGKLHLIDSIFKSRKREPENMDSLGYLIMLCYFLSAYILVYGW